MQHEMVALLCSVKLLVKQRIQTFRTHAFYKISLLQRKTDFRLEVSQNAKIL